MKTTNRFQFLKVLTCALLAVCMVLPPMPAQAQKTYRDATGGFLNETTFLPSAAYTTSNTSITPVDLGAYSSGLIVIQVTAVSGTSPSLTVNFQTCASSPGQTTPPATTACTLHTASSAITTTGVFLIKPLANFARWNTVSTTITGTTPSFTMQILGYFKPTS